MQGEGVQKRLLYHMNIHTPKHTHMHTHVHTEKLDYIHSLQPSLNSRWPPPQGSKQGGEEGGGGTGGRYQLCWMIRALPSSKTDRVSFQSCWLATDLVSIVWLHSCTLCIRIYSHAHTYTHTSHTCTHFPAVLIYQLPPNLFLHPVLEPVHGGDGM